MGNGVGLVLGLGIDPSGVKPGLAESQIALADYEKGLDDATREVNAGFEQTDKAIVSNSQSVRLLAQDLGIGLPRAVSSAVAKMLPDIATLGTAFIGIWAVEKIYDWAAAGVDKIREVYTAADQGIKDLDTAAAAAFKHAGAEASEMLTHFKTSLAGEFNIAEIDARMAQLIRYHNAFKAWGAEGQQNLKDLEAQTPETIRAIADAEKEGLQSLEDVNQKIAETGQLQFDAHKHLAEITAKEDKERANELKRQAREAAESAAKWERTTSEQYEYFKRAREEQARAAKGEEQDQKKLAKVADERIALEREESGWRIRVQGEIAKENAGMLKGIDLRRLSADIMRRFTEETEGSRFVKQQLLKIEPELTHAEAQADSLRLARIPAVQAEIKALDGVAKGTKLYQRDLQELIATIRNYMGLAPIQIQRAHETRISMQELRQDLLGVSDATMRAGIAAAVYGQSVGRAMEQAAKATLASIAGEMGVKSLEAAAYGAYYLAKYIASYGTDAAALAASEAYFVNATEFGALAGIAGGAGAAMPGGGRGGAGGGGSSTESRESTRGGGGGPSAPYPGGGPQSLPSAPSITLQYLGGAFCLQCPHCVQGIAAGLTQGVRTGTITSLVSTEAFQTNPR